MKTKTSWSVSDITGAKYAGILEFKDSKGEWHNFEVLITGPRLVFGGSTNTGFLESGFIPRESFERVDETLSELLAELEVYYNDGPQYVSRIVVNERM